MPERNDSDRSGRVTTRRRNVLKAAGVIAAGGIVGAASAGSASAQPSRQYAQAYKPDDWYAKTYAHVPDYEDGYVLGGYQYKPATNEADCYVTKVGSDGTQGWTNTYGDDHHNEAYDVKQTGDGYVCCGYSYDEDTYRYSDVYVVKMNEDGDADWEQTYSSGDRNEDRAYSVHSYEDGYVLGGYSYDYGGRGSRDFYVVDIDEEGEVKYENKYSYQDDWGWSILPRDDGGYVLGGYSSGERDYDDYSYRATGIDEDGEELWSNTYKFGYDARCYELAPREDGGYAMGGYAYSPRRSDYVYYLVACDSNGEVVYDENYYYPGYNSYCYSIDHTDDGGYVMYGYANRGDKDDGDYLMIKTNSEGGVDWYDAYSYGYDDVGWDVNYNEDGSYTACGYTTDYEGAKYAYAAKY
jgi:hypothetical protein